MNYFSFFKKYQVYLFVILCGCQKSLSLPSLKDKKFSTPWSVSERYGPSSSPEGPLQRILTLNGSGVDQVYVDRQEEDDENWIQIGLTNERGTFIDRDIDKTVRYRFGGKVVTPWYGSMKTLVLSSDMTLPAKIKGFHCLVPSQVTIYVEDKNLELNCQYITILGNIYSFRRGAQRDLRGLNAGNVKLIAEEINIQGRVLLLGQNGGEGKSVSKGLYYIGYSGKSGGSGGEVYLQYQNIQEVYDSFHVEGGRGGSSGSGLKRGKSNDSLEGQRGKVYRKKKDYPPSF